jgi:hypothetical protein
MLTALSGAVRIAERNMTLGELAESNRHTLACSALLKAPAGFPWDDFLADPEINLNALGELAAQDIRHAIVACEPGPNDADFIANDLHDLLTNH